MEAILQDALMVLQFLLRHMVFINFIFSIIIVFFQRREPKSVWAWLLILYSVPIVGFIIYLFAGTDMHKRKMFRLKEIEDHLNEAIRHQEHQITNQEMVEENPELKDYTDLIYYNLHSTGAILSGDNSVQVFTDGDKKFDALIEDIKNAKQFIHIQYYIIKNDVLFNRIREVLLEKVREGVEVRILYDGMGSRCVPERYWNKMREEGIQIVEFFPALLGRLHLRINYRNHRKIVVIDNAVAYVGGFNIGKEYIGLDQKFGYWRDTHLRIQGSEVSALQVRFVLDWNYAARENLFRNESYFLPQGDFTGSTMMQIISSGPDSALQNIRNNYLRLINKARKSIYIQTPYFIPDESILNVLIIAIHSGVEVNIMIPCKPDHPFVYWATYSYVGDMVMTGANCYTYNNGFLHVKGLIIDDAVYSYGTANMDIRSFQLNFEVNAVVYDKTEAQKMVQIFRDDLKYCKKITKDRYSRRNLIVRVREQFCRLLSPLL
ncbi:MAG: cardiolipin synthase [Lachnospiraceae bacterium]|nr:cardiolipin synthase [Lachnospiraceae bacterium]